MASLDDLLQTSQSIKSNTGWTQKPYSAVLICNSTQTDQNINANSKNDIYWQLYLCTAMNDKHLGLFTCVWQRTVRICKQLMITEMIAGFRRYKTWKGNGSMYIIHTNPSEEHTHTRTHLQIHFRKSSKCQKRWKICIIYTQTCI